MSKKIFPANADKRGNAQIPLSGTDGNPDNVLTQLSLNLLLMAIFEDLYHEVVKGYVTMSHVAELI